MKENFKSVRIRATHRLAAFSIVIVFFAALLALSGCSIKTTVKVPVPKNLAQDKTANLDELLQIVSRNDRIESLRSRIHISLTSGKEETGIIEISRKGSAVIALKRPDLLLLDILRPVLPGTVFELVSQGDEFKAWDSRNNKIYTGKNSAKVLVPANQRNGEEFRFPERPPHIFDAVLPKSVDLGSPGVRVSLEAQPGQEKRYYILVYSMDDGAHRSRILRKIWIERTGLTIARQQVYGEEGKIVSDTQYSQLTQIEGFSFPLTIDMNRPQDGYSLKLEFEDPRINPDMNSDLFTINRPGAENVPLVEK
jgi:outer membrane lipoprotein-sorting protein